MYDQLLPPLRIPPPPQEENIILLCGSLALSLCALSAFIAFWCYCYIQSRSLPIMPGDRPPNQQASIMPSYVHSVVCNMYAAEGLYV